MARTARFIKENRAKTCTKDSSHLAQLGLKHHKTYKDAKRASKHNTNKEPQQRQKWRHRTSPTALTARQLRLHHNFTGVPHSVASVMTATSLFDDLIDTGERRHIR